VLEETILSSAARGARGRAAFAFYKLLRQEALNRLMALRLDSERDLGTGLRAVGALDIICLLARNVVEGSVQKLWPVVVSAQDDIVRATAARFAHRPLSLPPHPLAASRLIEHKCYARTGRPPPHTPLNASEWHIDSHVRPNGEALRHRMQVNACFGLGSNRSASALSDPEVIEADKGQAQVEGDLWFLKDLVFFVSSLLVKTPCRIAGLLMVMTLALLVCAVTQRRLRHQVARLQAMGPNQHG
jgi:hypothetical protein